MPEATILERSFSLLWRMASWTLPSIYIFQYLRFSGRLDFLNRFSARIVAGSAFDQTVGQAFLANLGSAHIGGGVLVDMHRKGQLTLSGIVLASVFISFLPSIRLLLTRTAPAALSLLPLPAGIGYVLFLVAVALAKLLSARMLSNHFAIIGNAAAPQTVPAAAAPNCTGKTTAAAACPWRRAWQSTWQVGRRALLISFFSSLLIYWLSDKGAFACIPFSAARFGLPEQTLQVFAAWTAHPYAGMAIASYFATTGIMTSVDVLRVCIVCSMLTRPLWMIREAPGYYVGLYGLRTGILLMLYHLAALYILGAIVLSILAKC